MPTSALGKTSERSSGERLHGLISNHFGRANGRGWQPVGSAHPGTRAGDAQHCRLRSLRGPGGAQLVQPAVSSDKLFCFLFQTTPDLILRWLDDLPPDAGGYSFSAPVLKEREYRLDGLFTPPPQRPDLPAVVLEAQMAADAGFLLRLYAETARFLQQQAWTGDWRAVVICPHREL